MKSFRMITLVLAVAVFVFAFSACTDMPAAGGSPTGDYRGKTVHARISAIDGSEVTFMIYEFGSLSGGSAASVTFESGAQTDILSGTGDKIIIQGGGNANIIVSGGSVVAGTDAGQEGDIAFGTFVTVLTLRPENAVWCKVVSISVSAELLEGFAVGDYADVTFDSEGNVCGMVKTDREHTGDPSSTNDIIISTADPEIFEEPEE